MAKMEQGPPLERLLHRIAETPEDFLRDPWTGKESGTTPPVHVEAVVSDLIFDAGGDFVFGDEESPFRPSSQAKDRDYLLAVMILCHLYHDEWFINENKFSKKMLSFLKSKKLSALVKIVKPLAFINDPERREELARLALHGLDLYPEGENETIALDRLTTLDSVERKRIVKKTRAAQERARKLREEMARQEAEEAASKMMRE